MCEPDDPTCIKGQRGVGPSLRGNVAPAPGQPGSSSGPPIQGPPVFITPGTSADSGQFDKSPDTRGISERGIASPTVQRSAQDRVRRRRRRRNPSQTGLVERSSEPRSQIIQPESPTSLASPRVVTNPPEPMQIPSPRVLRLWGTTHAKQYVERLEAMMVVDELIPFFSNVQTMDEFFSHIYQYEADYILSFFDVLDSWAEKLEYEAANAPIQAGAPRVRGLTRFLAQLFPELRGFVATRRLIGTYRLGGLPYPEGHHIMSKAAYPRSIWSQMISISQEGMLAMGWDHGLISTMQGRLFRELARSGRPNTLREHIRIAVESLIAGHAEIEQARWLVAQAVRDLRRAGVSRPIRIPGVRRP